MEPRPQNPPGAGGDDLRIALNQWFDQPLGRTLQAVEASHLRLVLPSLYGTVALQLGRIGKLDLMDACVAPTRIVLDTVPGESGCRVAGEADALPFDQKSLDVVILPHTLDFARDPHQVLREVHRVLRPEGHVILTGFNPFSLWGLWRLAGRRSKRPPWCANFFALSRIKDWLALLEFEPTQGRMLYYRPPLQNENLMDRLHFLDKVGDRWWPLAAAVYLMVAKKRVFGMTPLRPVWEKNKAKGRTAATPAARVIYPRIPQWRLRRDL